LLQRASVWEKVTMHYIIYRKSSIASKKVFIEFVFLIAKAKKERIIGMSLMSCNPLLPATMSL
jgi:hypothetical protein